MKLDAPRPARRERRNTAASSRQRGRDLEPDQVRASRGGAPQSRRTARPWRAGRIAATAFASRGVDAAARLGRTVNPAAPGPRGATRELGIAAKRYIGSVGIMSPKYRQGVVSDRGDVGWANQ